MKIIDVLNANHGTTVEFKGVLVDKVLAATKTDTMMLSITLADVTGRISFPVFSLAEKLDKELQEGVAYNVSGVVNIWNGNVQIKSESMNKPPKFVELDKSEYEPTDFVGEYTIPQGFIKLFTDTVTDMASPYKELVMEATGCLGCNDERWKQFITAPSAEKHHGNKIGGLFLHTLGVLSNMMNIIKLYERLNVYGDLSNVINKDRLIAKAIIHDVEKINEYQYDTVIRRIPGAVGHLYDGVYLVSKINNSLDTPLERSEIENIKYSILSHHGQYGPCEPKTIEDMLLHLCDMIDSRVVGELEKQENKR